jgi:hypothetical protein
VTEDLVDIGSEPPGSGTSVQLGLDDDSTAHDVQAPGKSECCSNLRFAIAGLGHLDGRQL